MNKLFLPILTLFLLISCNDQVAAPGGQQSQSGAVQAKPSTIPKNSRGRTIEQQNIDDRLKVTMDPTKVMWIHLIALDGKIIRRMPVRNKVTSSHKRLEPKVAFEVSLNCRNGAGEIVPCSSMPSFENYYTTEIMGPDGTYGESDAYIYWFDPMGRYHQYGTAGGIGYLKTDYPIDLENPIDKITGLYNANEAAKAWQTQQEALLKKREEELKGQH